MLNNSFTKDVNDSNINNLKESAAVRLTDSAIKHFEKILSKNSAAIGIRLGVKNAGCSGLSYVIKVEDKMNDLDTVHQFDNVKVIIAQDHLAILAGMTVDYFTEGLNSQIKFINPNAKSSCGCGESFSVEK